MKNIIFYTLIITAAAGFYFYNNPIVNFTADKKGGVQFHRGTWNKALQLAKKENKLIFLDVYATWCGPCKKMKKYTFADKEVGQYYNEHFINVSLDGEQGDGSIISNRYVVTGYPALLFIDGDGKLVTQRNGYHTSQELLAAGKLSSQ
jgi:thioredoxin 1